MLVENVDYTIIEKDDKFTVFSVSIIPINGGGIKAVLVEGQPTGSICKALDSYVDDLRHNLGIVINYTITTVKGQTIVSSVVILPINRGGKQPFPVTGTGDSTKEALDNFVECLNALLVC